MAAAFYVLGTYWLLLLSCCRWLVRVQQQMDSWQQQNADMICQLSSKQQQHEEEQQQDSITSVVINPLAAAAGEAGDPDQFSSQQLLMREQDELAAAAVNPLADAAAAGREQLRMRQLHQQQGEVLDHPVAAAAVAAAAGQPGDKAGQQQSEDAAVVRTRSSSDGGISSSCNLPPLQLPLPHVCRAMHRVHKAGLTADEAAAGSTSADAAAVSSTILSNSTTVVQQVQTDSAAAAAAGLADGKAIADVRQLGAAGHNDGLGCTSLASISIHQRSLHQRSLQRQPGPAAADCIDAGNPQQQQRQCSGAAAAAAQLALGRPMSGIRCLSPDLALSFGGQQQQQQQQQPQHNHVDPSAAGSPSGMTVHTNTLYDLWDSKSFKRAAGPGSFKQADSFYVRDPASPNSTGDENRAVQHASSLAGAHNSLLDSTAAAAGSGSSGWRVDGAASASDAAQQAAGSPHSTGVLSCSGSSLSQPVGRLAPTQGLASTPRAKPALPGLPPLQHHVALSRLQAVGSAENDKNAAEDEHEQQPKQQQPRWPGLMDD
jgi:hypothetical protein